MIDKCLRNERDKQINSLQFGVSGVWNISSNQYLLEEIDNLRKILLSIDKIAIDLKPVECLHVTLLRYKSDFMPITNFDRVLNFYDSVIPFFKKFNIYSYKLSINEEGALRMYLHHDLDLTIIRNFSDKYIKRYELPISIPLNLWINLGEVYEYERQNIQNNGKYLFQKTFKLKNSIEVNEVILIYYKDILFRSCKVLKKYEL